MTALATTALPCRADAPRAGGRRGLAGLGWTGLAQLASLGIRLGSSLVLSRLLSPEAYGLYGPAYAVLMTLEWFSDLGLRPALVRHPEGGTPRYLATGWCLGLIRGAALGAAAAVLALPLAHLHAEPALAGVLAALALFPLLQALRSPGLPLLRRALNYRALFLDEIGQALAGTAVTLAAACWLHSAWAIVLGTLAAAAAGILISYRLYPMRPHWLWDRGAAGQLLHFSRQVFVNTLLMALWLNADRILGLRLVPLEEMGLYALAWNLAGVFDSLLSRACDVYFSLLAGTDTPRSQADRHHRTCTRLAIAVMPILTAGAVLAPPVVRLLYDPRYAGAGVLLAVLVGRLMFRALGQVQFQYLLARADIRPASAAYAAALAAELLMLGPMARAWGVLGLALAGLASAAVLALVQSVLVWRRGQERLAPFFLTLGWVGVALLLVLRPL